MKIKTVLIAILLAAVLAGEASAVTEIPAGNYTTGYALNTNGSSYVLTGDVFFESSAFIVSVSNITFDGRGFTVIYGNNSTGSGLIKQGVNAHNNTFKNVTLVHTNSSVAGDCVSMSTCTNNTYSDLRINTTNGIGILMLTGHRSNISNCTIISSGIGVRTSAMSSVISGCNIETSAGVGISLEAGGHDSSILNSRVKANSTYGISTSGADNLTVDNSTASGTSYGGSFANMSNSVIKNSVFNREGSTGGGILLTNLGHTNNTIDNCTGYGYGVNYGVYGIGGDHNSMLNSRFYGTNGIKLTGQNNTLDNCTGEASSGYGINFITATNNTIKDCLFTSVTGIGSYFTAPPIIFNNTYINNSVISPKRTTGSRSILMVGDSITANVGASGVASYGAPALTKLSGLNSNVDWKFINVGEGGYTTGEFLPYLGEYLELYHPEYVAIMLGTNDIDHDIPEDTIISNTLALAEMCVDAGAEPIIMAVTPRNDTDVTYKNENVIKLNTNMSVVAKNAGYVWLNMYDAMDSVPNNGVYDSIVLSYYSDGLHPVASGYALLGDYVGTELDAMDHMYMVPCTVSSSDAVKIKYASSVIPQSVRIPFVITPSEGNVSVNVTQWGAAGGYKKIWTESSETHDMTTQHIMGGFPAGATVIVNRDGIQYNSIESNATGFIEWDYTGGYSEHSFEAYVGETGEMDGTTYSLAGQWTSTVGMVGAIILIALAVQVIGMLRGQKKIGDLVGSVQGIVYILILLLVGTILFSQLL